MAESTLNPYVTAALIGGAGLLIYLAVSRNAPERRAQTDCGKVGNVRGGTASKPCTSSLGPFGYCSSDDVTAWRDRLSAQTQAVGQLAANMRDGDLYSTDFEAMVVTYLNAAAERINAWQPWFPDGGDVLPYVALVEQGCEILNEGNRRLGKENLTHLQVQEGAGVQVEPTGLGSGSGSLLGASGKTLGVVLLVAGLAYLGWQLNKVNKFLS